MKKALYLLLCAVLLVSLFCFPAAAVDEDMIAEIPTAAADAIVNEDGSKTWYADGVTYIEYPPMDTVLDVPSELEDYEVIIEKIEGITPYGPSSEVVSATYYFTMYDVDGEVTARYTVTVSGTYSSTALRAEIDSITCKFTYVTSSDYRSSVSWNDNTGTVRILLSGVAVNKNTFRLSTNGTITVT